MNSIETKIQQLADRYKARDLNNSDRLLTASDSSAIIETERRLGFLLPCPLKAIYRVFGGQEYVEPGITGIFGSHRLHTPQEIATNYEMFQDVTADVYEDPPSFDSLPGEHWKGWHPALIPFASWDAYNLVMCLHTERIYEYEPYSGISEQKFENIDHLLKAILKEAETAIEPSLNFITSEQTTV